MFIELEKTFDVLHAKFLKGVKWINANSNRPDIEKHKSDFQKDVMEPMDKTWDELPEDKQQEFLNQI